MLSIKTSFFKDFLKKFSDFTMFGKLVEMTNDFIIIRFFEEEGHYKHNRF